MISHQKGLTLTPRNDAIISKLLRCITTVEDVLSPHI